MADVHTFEAEAPSSEIPTTNGTKIDDGPTTPPEAVVTQGTFGQVGQPTTLPPTEAVAEAGELGVGAWYDNKKITALWANQSTRNAYVAVDGMGWKKLSNANDSSWVSMTMLASHAEQSAANVRIFIGSDGMVHEIYVW